MRGWGTFVVVSLVGASLGCTSIVEQVPDESRANSPVSPNPSVAGDPEPIATPTPEPEPEATPEPTPEPTPDPVAAQCAPGPGDGEGCPRLSPQFLHLVDEAIDRVGDKRPDLFDKRNSKGDGGWKIRDGRAYHWAVVDELQAMGVCATYDTEEIAVKPSGNNNFNDQYDIYLSSGHVRRGAGSYRATCHPAWF